MSPSADHPSVALSAPSTDYHPSKLAANTLIVQYDTIDDLTSRVEGTMFHTVIVHVQQVTPIHAQTVAEAIIKVRPNWHLCLYNPAAELLVLEVPSSSHEILHSNLRERFLQKLRNLNLGPEFEVEDISGTLCTSLSGDYSLAQPDSALRPLVQLDELSPSPKSSSQTTADSKDDADEDIAEPEDAGASTDNDVAAAAKEKSTIAANTPADSGEDPVVEMTDAPPIESVPASSAVSGAAGMSTTSTIAKSKSAVAVAEKKSQPGEAKEDKKKKKKKKLTEEEKAKRLEGRKKRAEKKKTFPSFVLEAGWAQSVLMLQTKARWWFDASDGKVRVVLIAKTVHSTGTIIIEKWLASTRQCVQSVEIKPRHGGCPVKKRKIPLQMDEQPETEAEPVDEDEQMLEKPDIPTLGSTEPIVPGLFEVRGGPICIEFNDIFLASPGNEPRPENDIVITEDELKEYACRVWTTAVAEDAG
ncbi:hypothetical protein CFO_g4138 [Ceratocystis platani]|uniref:Uncharacterized protein n=1 Tax=Ceratocystis fimbriata f. sp. platani TaxID=88771 RepID=A0A0F8DBV7_CERFI|nr:hypothetical protein CFO_g4138 [Ceratocystis platani]